MHVWNVPFHVIENEWTDDQFYAMFDRLGERLDEEKKAHDKANRKGSSKSSGGGSASQSHQIGAQEFLSSIGKPIRNEGLSDGD